MLNIWNRAARVQEVRRNRTGHAGKPAPGGWRLALAAVAVIAAAPVGRAMASGDNMIANGGFETGNLTDWTVFNPSGNFASVFVVKFQPYDGNYDVVFGGTADTAASISQTVAVTVGNLYDISFFERLAADPPDGATATLTDGSAVTTLLSFTDAPYFDAGYTEYTLDGYAAQTSSLTLTLGGYNPGNGIQYDDASIVDISASTVPEPGSLCILAAAAGLLAAARSLGRGRHTFQSRA
jgi:hypothetical protein